MDQAVRNKLRGVVTQCRKQLEESVSQELEGKFGIYATKKKDAVQVDDDARMTHLSAEDRRARKDILDHFEHIKARGFKPKDALDQLVREIAYTHLNRFCAYKMMEARQVYVGGQRFREAVSRGVNSNGVMFYLADHPEDERLYKTGKQDVAYRHFLDWLGGLLSEEIGVLFNPNDSANRLYPTQKVIDEVLGLVNDGALAEIWTQDETIGWVYQYFTPKELRDQARKESQAPRNSYELAFRNQFFTPRYVVEFLTDNTLGRIWYEMQKGNTKFKEQCRYMVRRPNEVFLTEGQTPLETTQNHEELSQKELLKQPVYVPHRPKKDPRELRILDPACGSGHFLLYCFDLLLTIYEEAYDDPEIGVALKKDYATAADFRKAIPAWILANNLHGIDIDLRCTQIAALALWLRCQRAYQQMGLKTDRLKITRSNLVCAEPMPGEEQMLKDFVLQLEPRLLGQLVEVVFDKMQLAGEAGSLLRIEEDIRDAVTAAKRQWLAKPISIQFSLFDEVPTLRQQRFDFSGITDEQFFKQAQKKVVDALRSYSEHAANGQKLQRRLFTDDTVRGFAFVDLCHKQYDVILMNPPFGLPTAAVFRYLERTSPSTYVEIYASFIERFLTGKHDGLVGAITSRSFTTMSRLEEWRTKSLLPRIAVLLDLGLGVMDDAFVEACAYVTSTKPLATDLVSLDFRSATNKEDTCRSLNWSSLPEERTLYLTARNRLNSMPQAKLLYSLDTKFHSLMVAPERFEPEAGVVRTGLTTFDDFRFLRLSWEVNPREIGRRIYWEFFSKGGEYAKYYTDVHLLVDRRNDGEGLAQANRRLNGQTAQSRQGSKYYYRSGLTFTSRSAKGFTVRALAAGCVISHNAPSIYPNDAELSHYVLAWINSRLIRSLVELQANAAYYVPGSVKELPWKSPDATCQQVLTHAGKKLGSLCAAARAPDELSPLFQGIPPTQSLRLTAAEEAERTELRSGEMRALQRRISDCVDELYQVETRTLATEVLGFDPDEEIVVNLHSVEDIAASCLMYVVGIIFGRWDVRKCLNYEEDHAIDLFQPVPVCSPGMLQGVDGLPLSTTPEGYPVTIDWDGILVDDIEHSHDIVRRTTQVLEVMCKDQALAIEKEASEILGVKELREYFRRLGKGGFWDDHLARYAKSRRKAPIYWMLQSSRKNYALWIYYHRLDKASWPCGPPPTMKILDVAVGTATSKRGGLTGFGLVGVFASSKNQQLAGHFREKDLLFKALVNYVEPKIQRETNRVDEMRREKQTASGAGSGTKKLDKDIERQEDLISELRDFEDKLRRAANLHLEPDLNDGVVLDMAPLHELVPWKEARNYWEELLEGKYEWSSIGKQLRQKGIVKE